MRPQFTAEQEARLEEFAQILEVKLDHVLPLFEELSQKRIRVHGSETCKGAVVEMNYDMRLIEVVAFMQDLSEEKVPSAA